MLKFYCYLLGETEDVELEGEEERVLAGELGEVLGWDDDVLGVGAVAEAAVFAETVNVLI